MSKSTTELTGAGQIRETFRLSNRGTVLMIESGWTGTIVRNGIVESDLGRALFIGPEFPRIVDGPKDVIALLVESAAETFFSVGASVRFFRPT